MIRFLKNCGLQDKFFLKGWITIFLANSLLGIDDNPVVQVMLIRIIANNFEFKELSLPLVRVKVDN